MRFLCRIIGHKAISQFDGTARCVRCDKRWHPEQGSWTIHAMRRIDPEWWREYSTSLPHVALKAFAQRNPDYGSKRP